jgi:AraC-like DNA-binding protein
MNTDERIIKNTHIEQKTSLPLYTEAYEISCSEDQAFHSHEFFEIGITLKGSVIHQTTNGQSLFSRGSVYMIPIGESHSFSIPNFWHVQNLYLLPRLIFQNLNINRFLDPLLNQFLLKPINKNSQTIIHLNLPESAVKDIEGLAEAYKRINLSNKLLLENYQSNCLFNMLMILCDAYYKEYPKETINKDVRIYKIMELIHENISSSTGYILNVISKELSLHPQYINKIIKKAISTNLSNLIIETKVEKSCELLLSNYTITEIAQSLAFYDHSHYNKYFIRYFGISPTQYRDKYNKPKNPLNESLISQGFCDNN